MKKLLIALMLLVSTAAQAHKFDEDKYRYEYYTIGVFGKTDIYATDKKLYAEIFMGCLDRAKTATVTNDDDGSDIVDSCRAAAEQVARFKVLQ